MVDFVRISMQTFSNVSPVKWSILALEASVWRGFSTPEILPVAGILVGIGVLTVGVGVILMSRMDS